MSIFYKGVGVGTYLHRSDLRLSGATAARSGASISAGEVIKHVRRGVTRSPFISLTSSYAIAEDYARNAGHKPPSRSDPAFVYEIDIPQDANSLSGGHSIIDPAEYMLRGFSDPLTSLYHHDGDFEFLAAVVQPHLHPTRLSTPPRRPTGLGGGTPAGPRLTIELETVVCALRDAEVLVWRNLEIAWVKNRFDVY